ncbi:hypothetical protein GMOD_00004753 [Pyrenophora seminiperda CCB06]|uniref:Secreted protein n=1 Tax=Pyrenophora seminiperda CCB06 TaxID=1302712 RepID=A0A3M7MHE1_9PLEO|nr:hypothetical protein GMOD_00004753 [Pyrenophora seminiperda CCB06]
MCRESLSAHIFHLLFAALSIPTHRFLPVKTRPRQRGSLTTQQGPDAIRVEEGLFRRLWAAPGGVCGVALPMLRRRGKAYGFHSFVPFNLFPTCSASSLADAHQALIFVN